MLQTIFRGFIEWIYELILEMWWFVADGLLSIMGLDFAYIQSHAPVIGQMEQLLLAAGWALLLGNLVFQALKSMAAGLGLEGEDPRLLFARTFVFAFLLLVSPQICRIGLDLTSNIMNLLSIPDAIDVQLVDESVFGALTAAWLMAMICSVIVMFKVLGLIIEVAERYVILFMLTLTAPLAFAMGGSKNTADIFRGWCRMFGSMCLLMVTNLLCCKMLFSVLATVPSGLDVLPWLVLIFAIVKVAKQSDEIITRIGLNPAITGRSGKSLISQVATTVARTATSAVMKKIGGGSAAGASSGGRTTFGFGSSAGSRFGGFRFGGNRSGPRGHNSTGGGYTYQLSNQQNTSGQSNFQQASSQQSAFSGGSVQQTGGQPGSISRLDAQQATNGSNAANSSTRTNMNQIGRQNQQTRRSSVPPGTRRTPSYVPSGGAPGTPATPGQGGVSALKQANTPANGGVSASRPNPAGTVPGGAAPRHSTGSHPGTAGTTVSQSSRSGHSTVHAAGGSTVHSSSQTSGQTTIMTAGRGVSTPPQAAPGSTVPRQPHPGGPVPAPGAVRPDAAGKPSRSTQRPDSMKRPDGSAARPGRNVPQSAAAPTVKGSARPGPAGTAPTGQRGASTKRPAWNPPKRTGPTHQPPQRKGGNTHGI